MTEARVETMVSSVAEIQPEPEGFRSLSAEYQHIHAAIAADGGT